MNEIVSATGLPNPAEALTALLGPDARKLSARLAGPSAEKAAKDFESILVYRMLEEMKRTIPDSGLLATGTSKQVQDMFWYYLAETLAEKGGLGLWKQLYTQFAGGAGRAAEPAP